MLRSDSGDYQAQEVLTPPVGTPVSFARGWALIDGTFEGKKFRFVTTHLEVEGFRATQEAQAREFLAGPARAPGAVIATGDFNSAADPATTDEPTDTYAALTKSWFDDAWAVNGGAPGLTCCQNSPLTNPLSQLRTRIDLILLHGPVRAQEAHVVGDTPFQTEPAAVGLGPRRRRGHPATALTNHRLARAGSPAVSPRADRGRRHSSARLLRSRVTIGRGSVSTASRNTSGRW